MKKRVAQGCSCCGVMPPYMVHRMIESNDPDLQKFGIRALQMDVRTRTARELGWPLGARGWTLRHRPGLKRKVFDLDHGIDIRVAEHGGLDPAREDLDQGPSPIDDVNWAFDNAKIVYDYYKLLGRDSLDGKGYPLFFHVRVGGFINALWDNSQVFYGGGDGKDILSFAKPLSIAAHELTHGVVSFSSVIDLHGESGAVHESFCDAMAVVIQQWRASVAVEPDWIIGRGVFGGKLADVAGIRSFTAAPAFENHPILGDDPQVKHYANFARLGDDDDSGGIHTNSGIGNLAFYKVCQAIGGNSWDIPARIWYDAFTSRLKPRWGRSSKPQALSYKQAAAATAQSAEELYSVAERDKVVEAWREVGVEI
jgi:Zn-dependent metalloprotease